MAFCIKRRESVSKAIRRLGRERIEHACKYLKDCNHAAGIHCARKDIKKIRALLRLVAHELKKLRRIEKPLADASKLLAQPRDALVKTESIAKLIHHFKGQLAPGAFRHIRRELKAGFEAELKRATKENIGKAVAGKLRRAAKVLEGIELKSKGWKALNPGVKAAYAAARRDYQLCLKDASPENFHEFRKRTKDLWYQVTLLQRVWPEQMEAMAEELEILSDRLGDSHDLAILEEDLRKFGSAKHYAREWETLHGLIAEQEREFQAAALAIGARFFTEKPSAFCNRLAVYWEVWRGERKPARVV
jgi:CHAD domain-containing protein